MIDITNIRAIILDCDGLLIDTTVYGFEAWRSVYARNRAELKEYEYATLAQHGPECTYSHLEAATGRMLTDEEKTDIRAGRRQFITEQVQRNGLKRGALAVIIACEQAGIPVAVASNTPHNILVSRLHDLGVYGRLAAVSGMSRRLAPKPAPDVLLAAAERIKTAPERIKTAPEHCLAIDNSMTGIRAALAAGMQTAIIPDHVTQHEDLTGCPDRLKSLYALAAMLETVTGTTTPATAPQNPFELM